MAQSPPAPVRLWDAPVRLIHWSFVLLMPALWWTAEKGPMALHKQLGMVALALLILRLFWGFAGSSTARFSGFLKGPGAAFAYARNLFAKGEEPIVGHNPLGGWSVVALLLLLIAQTVVGLFAQDVDGIESGPLTHYISYDLADTARHWHHLLFNVLLGFIALHIAAIAFYALVKRENLIGPMVSGRRRYARAVAAPRLAPPWLALVGLVLAAGLSWWVWKGAPLPHAHAPTAAARPAG